MGLGTGLGRGRRGYRGGWGYSAGGGAWAAGEAVEGGATGLVGAARGSCSSPDSQVPLTEIGGLHGVVEVLGRPWGNAVGASDPWGQGAASCPIRSGPGPRLMPQNVHQSPRGAERRLAAAWGRGWSRQWERPGFSSLPVLPSAGVSRAGLLACSRTRR